MASKKRIIRKMKPEISPAASKYFATGNYEVDDEGAADLFIVQGNPEKVIAFWETVKEEFMTAWGKNHSGKSPWILKAIADFRRDKKNGSSEV